MSNHVVDDHIRRLVIEELLEEAERENLEEYNDGHFQLAVEWLEHKLVTLAPESI